MRVVEDVHGVELDWAVAVFMRERPRLLRLAYRVVGDKERAEDVVQDAWLRWQGVDRGEIKNPAAFLTTATTHLAINLIQSARHRHETPTDTLRVVASEPTQEPAGHAERAIAVERMLEFLMMKLTATELAAYVLRKSFDYPYQVIADLLGMTAPNARQLVRRGQIGIGGNRTAVVDSVSHRALVAAFRAATEDGRLEPLETILVDGVTRRRSAA
jgi:RNA polymerase sigma factor (sigma-70 family)